MTDNQENLLNEVIKSSPILQNIPRDHPLFSMAFLLVTALKTANYTVDPYITASDTGTIEFPYKGGLTWLASDAPEEATLAAQFLITHKRVIDSFDESAIFEQAMEAIFTSGFATREMSVIAATGRTIDEVCEYYNKNKKANSGRRKADISEQVARIAEKRIEGHLNDGLSKSKAETRVAIELYAEGIGPDVTVKWTPIIGPRA